MNEITEGVITSSPSTEKTLIDYDFILEFQAEELMFKSEVDALVSTSLQLLNESCESVTDVMKVHDVQVNDQSLSINRDFLILDITMHTSTDANRIINEKSDREAISNCFESNYRSITDSISTQRAILVGDTFQVQQTQREFPVLIVSLIAGGCAVALMLIFLMDRNLRKRYEDDLDNVSDVENAEIRRSENKDEFHNNPIQHQMMQVVNKTQTNTIPNNPNQQYRSPVQYVRPSSRLNLDLEEMSSDESLLSLAKDCAETPTESCAHDEQLFQNTSFGQRNYEEEIEQHNSSNASATYRNERKYKDNIDMIMDDIHCTMTDVESIINDGQSAPYSRKSSQYPNRTEEESHISNKFLSEVSPPPSLASNKRTQSKVSSISRSPSHISYEATNDAGCQGRWIDMIDMGKYVGHLGHQYDNNNRSNENKPKSRFSSRIEMEI